MTFVPVVSLLRIFYRRVLLIGEYMGRMLKIFIIFRGIRRILNNLRFCCCNRCGALSLGDQILSIDDTMIENSSYTPDEVMSFLNGPSDRGFTQIQILPVHAINRKGTILHSICDSRIPY